MHKAQLPVLLLAFSCTSNVLPGAGGSSSSSSSSSSGGGSMESVVASGYRAVLYANCDYQERCKATSGPAYSTVEGCRAAVDKDLLLNRAKYDGMSLAYGADTAKLASCTTLLSQAMCANRIPPELLACLDALAPLIPRTAGEVCTQDAYLGGPRCVESSKNRCNPSPGGTGCGVCAARKDNGAMCSVGDECLTGYCQPIVNTCGDVPNGKNANEGCFDTVECRGNLVCAGGVLQKKCQPRVGPGEACSGGRNGDLPECVQDLVCVGGTCARPLADGSTCTRQSGTSAGCQGFCIFASPDAAMGTCASPATLPGAGQACAIHNVGTNTVPACSSQEDVFAGETFDNGTPSRAVACTCTARAAAGAACGKDDACQSHTCDGEGPTVAGTCTALRQNGATCTNNTQCQTQFCGGTGNSRTCQAAPACQ